MEVSRCLLVASNLTRLATVTQPSNELLNVFVTKRVLNQEQVNVINSVSGNEKKAYYMYALLMNQARGFEALSEALQSTCQDVALNILSTGQFTRIENIHCSETMIIGKGSGGNVFEGTFGRRKVAVKKIPLIEGYGNIQEQINTIVKCDAHKNIVKYVSSDIEGDFYRLALEYCQGSLLDWMRSDPKVFSFVLSAKDVLYQTTKGLAYLHEKGLIHNNLKPSNILLHMDDGVGRVRIKISDFGFSKFLSGSKTSRTFVLNQGSERWCPKEVLDYIDSNQKQPLNLENSQVKIESSRASDIFSLGCVFYVVLSNGDHPFGDTEVEIRENILSGTPTANENDLALDFQDNGSISLIQSAINSSKLDRPVASDIFCHPIFWDETKSLQFLVDISDKTERLNSISSLCVDQVELQSSKFQVLKTSEGWLSEKILCSDVKQYLENNRYRRFSNKNGRMEGQNVMQLVRAIRNLHNHYTSLPSNVRNVLGTVPVNYLKYWTTKFPWLVNLVWLGFQDFKNDLAPCYYHRGTYKYT